MAIEYDLFSGLDVGDLRRRLDMAAVEAGDLWTHSSATGDLGPFAWDILAEQGHVGEFRSRAYVRFDKFRSIEAKRKLQDFYRSLPAPKVVLFQMDPTDQDTFLEPIPHDASE